MTLGVSRSMAVDCVYSLGGSLLLEFGSRCNFEIQECQDYHRQRYRKNFGSLVVISGIQFSRIVVLCRVYTDSLLFSTFILSFFRFPLWRGFTIDFVMLSIPLTYC